MLHEFEQHQLRRHWAEETPPSDLADRIIRHALAQPQHRPFLARLRDGLRLPERPMAMRGLAVAACLMIAVIAVEQSTVTSTRDGKTVKYVKPMDQIVEEMIWSDYGY